MELKDLVSVAFASLIVLVVAHLAVFWVVKTLYPPPVPNPTPMPVQVPVVQEPVKTVTFTEPPVTEQQNVTVPTYETPLPSQAPNQEGEPTRKGPPPAESTSIRGKSGVDVSNTQ